MTAQPDADSADELVAEAAKEDRRMTRKRDLILGSLLLVGGLVVCAFVYLTLRDAYNPKPSPLRPPTPEGTRYPIFLSVAAVMMVVAGLMQTIRGLRARA